MHVWEVTTGALIFRIDPGLRRVFPIFAAPWRLRSNMLNFPAPLSTGIFTPDGRHLVAFRDDAMRVFHALNGKPEVVLEQAHDAGWPVYSHDSTLVALLGMNARTAGCGTSGPGGSCIGGLNT